MSDVTLTISGEGVDRQVELNAAGTVIGRSGQCDVVIDTPEVSRQHARLSRDPFGRWIVEDLGSSNGTFLNGVRIQACPIPPGQAILVGPVHLSIDEPVEDRIDVDASAAAPNVVVEDFGMEVFYERQELVARSAGVRPQRLDEITERLSKLTSLRALYPEVCRCLAQVPATAAAVLRVPRKDAPLPKSPDVLAYQFASSPDDTAPRMPLRAGHGLAFRISGRILEAARSRNEAVMAKSVYSPDTKVTMAFIDEHSPRATICAPLGGAGDELDLLYVDVPIEPRTAVGPEEMFALVRLVAQELASARQNLAPVHARSERRALDHELSLASQLQTRLAPRIEKDFSGVDVGLVYRPVLWVGGDYCDLWTLDDKRVAFALGQVQETGLPAAMAISNLRILLRSTLSLSGDVARSVQHVNAHLIASCPEPIHASLFVGIYDATNGTLKYANVGGLQPVIAHPRTGFTALDQSEQSTMGGANLKVTAHDAAVANGARLVAFSRGLVNTPSRDAGPFGLDRVMNVLKQVAGQAAQETADSLVKAVCDFQGPVAQQEDYSILIMARQ